MENVRTRIAPSPSGFLHIGTAKMALFNWLLARKHGGTFVLRLEDTDAARTGEEFAQAMCEGFDWLGIDWDEGPEFGGRPQRGEYGPYRQSRCKEEHRKEALRLVEEGKAYKCFSTKEEIDAFREANPHGRFVSPWREADAEQIAAQGDAPHAVRFRVPEGETVIHDLVQGDVRFNNKEYDDFVILKPNGDPVFHLSVVVDDARMKITHVMRGDDHLSNAVRHVMLFEALGYPLPQFAHLPLVHDENGKKFSKRLHGANVLDWRADGYLPEALINYVALLGWTSEEENKEFFTREELVRAFSLERLGKGAARFDLKKLNWLNGQHIRCLSREEVLDRVLPILHGAGLDTSGKSRAWLLEMVGICHEKLATLNDIILHTDYFFQEVTSYDEKGVKKQFTKADSPNWLRAAIEALESASAWDRETLHAAYEAKSEATGFGLGKLVNPTRLALTGKPVGPGLFELAELLGHETCMERMRRGLEYVEQLETAAG